MQSRSARREQLYLNCNQAISRMRSAPSHLRIAPHCCLGYLGTDGKLMPVSTSKSQPPLDLTYFVSGRRKTKARAPSANSC